MTSCLKKVTLYLCCQRRCVDQRLSAKAIEPMLFKFSQNLDDQKRCTKISFETLKHLYFSIDVSIVFENPGCGPHLREYSPNGGLKCTITNRKA